MESIIIEFPAGKEVVISFDIGTAFAGIAFITRSDTSNVPASAPKTIDPQKKAPTVMLKTEEGQWLFGHSALERIKSVAITAEDVDNAVSNLKLFKLFKLNLLNSEEVDFEDVTVDAHNTHHIESLLDVYVHTMIALKEHALSRVEQNLGRSIAINDVLWVLTVPADMSEYCKQFMREAAARAGLIADRHSHDLVFIYEPEAAAIALAYGDRSGFFAIDQTFLVADGGGGTDDYTTHKVIGVEPLVLSSLAKRTGGTNGAEKINEAFKHWLTTRIRGLNEDEVAEIDKRAAAMFQIMQDFDKIKVGLDEGSEIPYISLRDLFDNCRDTMSAFGDMLDDYNSVQDVASKVKYIRHNANLQLPYTLVASFFEPLVVNIVQNIRNVLAEAAGRGNVINSIVCVGGFSASPILQNRLIAEFRTASNMTVLFPNIRMHPQAAVVVGAARYGSMLRHMNIHVEHPIPPPPPIMNRIATKTIGVFFEPNCFRVLVRIGEEVPVNMTKELVGLPVNNRQTECLWKLYQSNKINPVTTDEEELLGLLSVPVPQVGTTQDRRMVAKISFGEAEISVKVAFPTLDRETTGLIRFGQL